MIQIEDTLISEDIFDKNFVCNIEKCKGMCCVEGDAGAPVEEEEKEILNQIYEKVKPYMTQKGIEEVQRQGVCIETQQGLETPLIDGRDCAYVYRDQSGAALCAIEKAYREGKTTWKKPISCHLYPIRVSQVSSYRALNYNKWNICRDACLLGEELKIPVYKFVKEALVRKFGQSWYDKLEMAKNCLDRQREKAREKGK